MIDQREMRAAAPRSHRSTLPSRLIVPIELDHLSEVAGLPFHHRDPFDRLLIAQEKFEQMPLVSADSSFDPYGVRRIW